MSHGKRIVAGIVAAVIGTIMLFMVVNNQNKSTDVQVGDVGSAVVVNSVVVVKTAIPGQTPVELISESVEVVQVPANLIAPGAVTSLNEITAGFVTSTEIFPGEQLLLARFRSPESLTRIQVPDSLQEVTIPVVPERAVGGAFTPGDTLGVIVSFGAGDSGQNTSFILHRALVTAIQYSAGDVSGANAAASGSETSARSAPTDRLLITFAVSSLDAARLVFAAEFGNIWLTLEGPSATVGGEGIVTLKQLLVPR